MGESPDIDSERGAQGSTIYLDPEEFQNRVAKSGGATSDDVSITLDGRRLDSEEAVLSYVKEFEAKRRNGQLARE